MGDVLSVGFFSAIFGLISFFRFEWGILFTLFALPLYVVRFQIGFLPSTLLEALILILAAIWILRKIENKEKEPIWRQPFFFAVLFFVASATIAVFVSPEKRAALGIWRAYFIEPAVFFFILIDYLQGRQFFQKVFFASIASSVFVAAIALYQGIKIAAVPFWGVEELRATSLFPYANAVGLYVAPIIPFLWSACIFLKKPIYRITSAAAGVGMVGAIVFSQTEAALAALGISGLVFLFVWTKGTRKVAATLILVSFLVPTVSPPAATFLERKLTLKDWSGKVRKGIWKETLAMLQDHPIFGAGLAGYKTVFEPYHTRKHIEIFQYPHSLVLNFWSETGVLGLLSFFLLIGFFFYYIISIMRRMRTLPRSDESNFYRAVSLALLCSMITILVHGLVDVPYFKNDLSVYFFTLFALAFSLHRKVKEISHP